LRILAKVTIFKHQPGSISSMQLLLM